MDAPSPGAAVVCSFSRTVVVDSKSRFSFIYYLEQLITGEMDTILEKKVSIQPGILSSPIGQMSEQRYRKLMTFKATKEINDQPQFEPMSVAGGQGVFSVPPILVPAAP